jgi:hypothetical protein
MASKAVIFAGPSLTSDDLAGIDRTRFDVRPPIRRGDLPTVVTEGCTQVAIVDGDFYQSLAVSPKEILSCLCAGCTVVGGASMGALRAAELYPYGMTGVGEIYRWYRTGQLTRDDDVAVTYAMVDDEYHLLSAPMVNVLWVSRAAGVDGWLDVATRRRISCAARRIPWAHRTWPSVCRQARLNEDDTRAVLQYSSDPAHNLKRLDGLAVIRTLASSDRERLN